MEILQLLFAIVQIAVGTATLVVGIKVWRKERGEDDEK